MNKIYLIRSLEESVYKVGVSKHPERRLNALQTGNASKLKLITSYESEFAYKIEKALQRRYSYLNKEGEWFDMSLNNEFSFIEECRKLEENFNYLKEKGNVFI